MNILKNGDSIGIIACSNGQPLTNKNKIESLLLQLKSLNLNPICSKYIYEINSPFNGSGFPIPTKPFLRSIYGFI